MSFENGQNYTNQPQSTYWIVCYFNYCKILNFYIDEQSNLITDHDFYIFAKMIESGNTYQ